MRLYSGSAKKILEACSQEETLTPVPKSCSDPFAPEDPEPAVICGGAGPQ